MTDSNPLPPVETANAPAWLKPLKPLKPYLRWVILGLTLFFLSKTLKDHWQEVLALRLTPTGVQLLGAAMLVTLIAQGWSGWVWGWLLRDCGHPQTARWAIATYLRTNIAKYLPGNIWHFYGRLQASRQRGIPSAAALLSIVLEPLLMAAAALLLASVSYFFSPLQYVGLGALLMAIHPRWLNPLLKRLAQGKLKALSRRTSANLSSNLSPSLSPNPSSETTVQLARYPLKPLLGEVGFVGLRALGFLLALMALTIPTIAQIPAILSAFSLAWVLGLVVPGAPGGIGVFEATAIALLQGQLPPAIILGAVACYRLISTFAEGLGAIAARP